MQPCLKLNHLIFFNYVNQQVSINTLFLPLANMIGFLSSAIKRIFNNTEILISLTQTLCIFRHKNTRSLNYRRETQSDRGKETEQRGFWTWNSFSTDPRIRVSRNSSYKVIVTTLRETPRSPNLCPKHTVVSTSLVMELLAPQVIPPSEKGSWNPTPNSNLALVIFCLSTKFPFLVA